MNNEQYENIIELLKQALNFYANKDNYFGAMGNQALIEYDEYGFQARQILDRVNNIVEENNKIEKQYLELNIDDEANSVEASINNKINEIIKLAEEENDNKV